MSAKAKWTVSGTRVENSTESFMKAVQHVSNPKTLKKYENKLNKSFKANIRRNLQRAGIGDRNFDDVLFLKITNGGIVFTNTEPLATQRYEYGYIDSGKVGSEEIYADDLLVGTSPRYFIRPAIQKTMKEVGEILIREANQEYMNVRRETNGDDVY